MQFLPIQYDPLSGEPSNAVTAGLGYIPDIVDGEVPRKQTTAVTIVIVVVVVVILLVALLIGGFFYEKKKDAHAQ